LNFLLDTNVVSEWAKPLPNRNVIKWLAEADEDRLYLSVLTFAEIKRGIEQMPFGQRRNALKSWLQDDLSERFEGRILLVDVPVAGFWCVIMAQSAAMGISLSVMDGFFAATAHTHHLTLVTRNTKDFENLRIPLLNPWIRGA